MRTEDHLNTQRIIIGALGNIKDKRATERLLEFLNHTNPYFRSNAITSLGKIGDEKAVPALIKCLSDKDKSNQYEAARVLKIIGTPEAISAASSWHKLLNLS